MRIFIFAISILFFFACGQSETKPVGPKTKVGVNKAKKSNKKNVKAKKLAKNNAINTNIKKDNIYWNKMKRQVGLSDDQLKKLKALDRKFTRQIDALKKQNKWDGNTNKKTRKQMSNKIERQQELIVGKAKIAALIKYQK